MENNSYLTEVSQEDLLIMQNQQIADGLRDGFQLFQNQLLQRLPQLQTTTPQHQQMIIQHEGEEGGEETSMSSVNVATGEKDGEAKDFLGNLIEEVRTYRCLWDVSCRGFKELPKKQQAWAQIAQQLNTNAKEAQTQWQKLKDNFRKCLKRRERATRSGAGKTTLPTCQYFKELLFITDTVTNKPTVSNIPQKPDIFTPPDSPVFAVAQSPTHMVNESYDAANSDAFETPSSASKTNMMRVNKKRKNEMSDVDKLLMASIQRDLNTPTSAPQPDNNDPDTMFCLSLVEDFKSLPANKKRLARLKVMQVLSEMHEDTNE